MSKTLRRLFLLGAVLFAFSSFFACHLGSTQEAEETFTFPTLKDSIGTADSVLIVLKDQGGRVVDTLFNGKVTAFTQFTDLKADHYAGGKIFIFIEATKEGKLVYKAERGFDPAQGGNIEGTKVIHVSPSNSVDFDWSDPKMVEGESAPLPKLKFTPSELASKQVIFTSRQTFILAADSASLRALKAGNATLVVCLQSDTTRCDSLVVAVSAKPDQKSPDSIFLSPDPLELSLGGTDRFTVRVSPSTASSQVQWILVSGTSIRVDSNGTLNALGEGTSKVAAFSKLNDKVSDTATVTVLPIVTPNRPKVEGPVLPVNTLTPQWTWTSGGNGGNGTYRYRLDIPDLSAAPTTTDLSFTAPSNLSEGTHTLFVQERNAAGNWSQNGGWPIRIDTTAPKAPSVSIKENSPTSTVRPTWTWAGDTGDAHRYYRYKLDSDDFRTGAKDTRDTSFRPDADLSNGTHVLYVQERDTAGNWSLSGSASIVVDTIRPAAPTVNGPALTNDSTPTWTWTTATTGTMTFRYRLDNADLSMGATTTTQKEFTPASNLAEGPHTLYVQERDAAGNWSNSGSREIRLDLTKPTEPRIDSTPYSPLNSLRPRFTWRSGTGGAKVFRARIDNADLSGVVEQADSSLASSADLSEGRHTLFVQERDSAGNWSSLVKRDLVLSLRGPMGIAGFSSGAVEFTSMVLSDGGVPFLAFMDRANGDKATVMRFNGKNWEFVGSAGFSDGEVDNLSLALTVTGTPYLAYRDKSRELKATVARYNGIAWETVGTPGFSSGSIGNISLAINDAGIPHVAFTDGSKENKATVMKFEGLSWEFVGGSGFSPNHAWDPSLMFQEGIPYLAFQDEKDFNSKAMVMCYRGVTWETVGGSEASSGGAGKPSLAFNSLGTPYIAFSDLTNDSKLTVRRVVGSAWETVGVSGISAGAASFISLKIGSDGVPFVGYMDAEYGLKATVIRFNGSAWVAVGGPGISAGGASYLTLAITSTGIPLVAFSDVANGRKATVLKTSFDP